MAVVVVMIGLSPMIDQVLVVAETGAAPAKQLQIGAAVVPQLLPEVMTGEHPVRQLVPLSKKKNRAMIGIKT